MMRLLGIFVPVLRESVEMLYQNEADYVFDSSKFDRAFPDFGKTTYAAGIAATAAYYRQAQA